MIKKIAVAAGATAFLLVFLGVIFLGLQWMRSQVDEEIFTPFLLLGIFLFIGLAGAVADIIAKGIKKP